MSETAAKPVIETPLLEIHKDAGASIGNWFGCSLPDRFGDDWLAEYRAARESVALIDKNYRAYLLFTGPDRVRYLNAILTNDIKSLSPGNGVVSLFLNPQGRIQAEIETYAEAESLFCVSYAMIRESLIPALDKFIIMDDVTLADKTSTFGTVALEGPKAAELVKKLTSVDLASLGELSFQETSVAGISCGLTKRSPGGVAGAEFLAAQEDLPRLWQMLREETEKMGGRAMGYQALNALRERALVDRREELLVEFPTALAAGKVKNNWRSAAEGLYRNWLLYICAQKKQKQPDYSRCFVTDAESGGMVAPKPKRSGTAKR